MVVVKEKLNRHVGKYSVRKESGADSGRLFAAGAVSGRISSDYFLRTGRRGLGVRGSHYFDGKN